MKNVYRIILLSVLIIDIACITQAQERLIRFQQSSPAMGTTFKLIFYAQSQQQAEQAASMAFARIDQLNQIFSDYIEDSEVSQLVLNAGQRVPVSKELWHLTRLSKKIARESKGAFDITIGPLTKIWRRAIRQREFPDSGQIAEARSLVNYRWIKLYPAKQEVRLKKRGMKLDFGGIAKGYAVDQAYEVLKGHGITIALIDGGGDLFISAHPPGEVRWDIKDHRGKQIEVNPPCAVASSGDSFQHLSWNSNRYSHIIDPQSGLGLQDSQVVTVIAPNATIADALSSAISVLPEEKRTKLLSKYHATLLE